MVHNTGMSFGRWRRELAVVLAVRALASGISLKQIAAELGYDSTGSFIAMFRKTVGTSPMRCVANQQAPSWNAQSDGHDEG